MCYTVIPINCIGDSHALTSNVVGKGKHDGMIGDSLAQRALSIPSTPMKSEHATTHYQEPMMNVARLPMDDGCKFIRKRNFRNSAS